MSSVARKLLRAALRLPTKERAAVARSLIQSLDKEEDPDAEASWAKEVTRRVEDLDAGKMKLVPWSEVRRKLYRKTRPSPHARR